MISSFNLHYRSEADWEQLPPKVLAHARERMLIQVFSGVLDEALIRTLLAELDARFHGAAILGTTTAGEVMQGQALDNAMVINFSCFEYATVRSALVTQNDDLELAGCQLGEALQQADTQAVIAFGCGIKEKRTIFAQPMLDALHQKMPNALISGGQAGDNGLGTHTLVFTQDGLTSHGVAAASVAGAQLVARNGYTLSWVPIGKLLTITSAQGSRVFSIDDKTPYEIYSHYLGQEVADNLPLSAADFPLIIERDGVQMAIHATGVNPDGSFDYIHHFHAGEQLKFGYCHAGLLALGAEKLRSELSTAAAQVTYIYTCVSRKWILGADILVELAPLETLASSVGFFCYGEYFARPHQDPLFLSQTLTVLCLSETDTASTKNLGATQTTEIAQPESRQFRTMRVLHRLVETSAREIESKNLELSSLARKDSLTGLFNRRMFDEQLAREIKRLRRNRSQLSLVMLDVDHFKRYNDAYGHVMGDSCLRAVGQVLRTVAQRESDTTARYGGEEFAIVLPGSNHANALALAQAVRQGIAQLDIPHRESCTAPHVTASLGVVTVLVDEDLDPHSLVSQCDAQLYRAKTEGRNRVCGLNLSSASDAPSP